MAAKQKQIQERLEAIKSRASEYAANPKQTDPKAAANLAEEAAGLGLELAELLEQKGK